MRTALLRAGSAIAAMRLAGAALGAGVTILLGRMLGPEALGHYAFLVAALAIAAIPVSSGWGALTLRATARAHATGDWSDPPAMAREGRKWAFAWALLAALAGLAAHMLAPGWFGPRGVAGGLGGAAIGLLTLALLFDQISALRANVLRGIGRQALAQLPEMIVRPLVLAAAFLAGQQLARSADPLLLALAALLAGSLAAALLGSLLLARHAPPAFAASPAGERDPAWTAQAMVLAGTMGVAVINGYADILMLGTLGNASETGLYRVAMQLALFGNLGYTALNMLANQRFAALRAAGREQDLQQAASLLARMAALTAFAALAVFFLAGGPLIALLFGSRFTGAAMPLAILSLGQFINAGFGMASSALMMHDREFRVLGVNLAALAVGLAANAALIPAYGAVGAAWANVIAMTVWNGLLWWNALRLTGLDTSAPGIFARR